MNTSFEQALDWLCAKMVTYLPQYARRYDVRMRFHADHDVIGVLIGDVKGAIEANLPEKKQQRAYDSLYTRLEDLRATAKSPGVVSFIGVVNSDRREGQPGFQVSIAYEDGVKVECHLHAYGQLLEEQ